MIDTKYCPACRVNFTVEWDECAHVYEMGVEELDTSDYTEEEQTIVVCPFCGEDAEKAE